MTYYWENSPKWILIIPCANRFTHFQTNWSKSEEQALLSIKSEEQALLSIKSEEQALLSTKSEEQASLGVKSYSALTSPHPVSQGTTVNPVQS